MNDQTLSNSPLVFEPLDQTMSILDKHLAFVNNQAEFHKSRAELYAHIPKRQQKHLDTARQFTELAEFIRQLAAKPPADSTKEISKQKLSLTRAELEGLPQELLNELSTSGTDTVGYAILDLMESRGGVMSLDQIIVGLYRELGEVHKRQSVTSRMYRMAQRGLVKPVAGKKGVYAIAEDGGNLDDGGQEELEME